MNKKRTLLALSAMAFILLLPTYSPAGLKDLLKKKSKDVDISGLVQQQGSLIVSLVAGMEEYSSGQKYIANALGLKEEAEKIESEHEALASGNVNDEDSIKRSMRRSSSSQELIDQKISEGNALSEEAKGEFVKALPHYARGTAHTLNLLPQVKDWGSASAVAMKDAGLVNSVKMKRDLESGLYIAKALPDYAKNAKNSYDSLISYSRSNNIDTSVAEDLLDDMFQDLEY
jgi:hypothetical protein